MEVLAMNATSLVVFLTITVTFIYVVYLLALPRPIPGIPYNKHSAKRLFGDLPEFAVLQSQGLSEKLLWSSIAAKTRSPIAQTFMLPFMRPCVVVADYREIHDLTTRRAKDLGRGRINNKVWGGLVPEHFIAMEDHDVRFRGARNLVKDLMTPNFLHEVSNIFIRLKRKCWLLALTFR
jgi:hypothetical protein